MISSFRNLDIVKPQENHSGKGYLNTAISYRLEQGVAAFLSF